MFKHGKTDKKIYSIKEKIKYYKGIINGSVECNDTKTKRKAKLRLKSLQKLDNRTFDEPTLIVTDDKHYGNKIAKPRLCVVTAKDNKGRLFVAPVYRKTSKDIVLDKQIDRQISKTSEGHNKWIDISDVYETKLLTGVKALTKYDKAKIRDLYHK